MKDGREKRPDVLNVNHGDLIDVIAVQVNDPTVDRQNYNAKNRDEMQGPNVNLNDKRRAAVELTQGNR